MAIPKHRLTNFERILFVITGTSRPGKAPAEASFELMDKVHSRFRIGLMVGMMAFSIVGAWYATKKGKRVVENKEDSLYARNKARYNK